MPETIVTSIAAASIGAVWSSASPDFGVQGVLDRFGQIQPKVLLSADGYFYGGKSHDCLERLKGIAAGLPTLDRVVVVPYVRDTLSLNGIPDAVTWSEFLRPYQPREIAFAQVPFNHPLYIL